MKPATIILGGALLLVTAGSSAIILKQRAEIAALRAREASAQTAARASQRIDPEPTRDAGSTQPPAPETVAPPGPAGALRPISPDTQVAQARPEQRRRSANRFAELLADPEIASLMTAQRKAELDGSYAALFRKLGLNGAEIDALKELIAEKELARIETRAVARAEGFTGNDREAYRDFLNESNGDVDARIEALLGTDRYATLEKYEATARERSRVNQLDLRLSYTSAPLQPYQTDALVEILASAGEEPRAAGRLQNPGGFEAYLAELEAYDKAVLSRAQAVLSPAQYQAVLELQQERINRVRLGELMRRRGAGD